MLKDKMKKTFVCMLVCLAVVRSAVAEIRVETCAPGWTFAEIERPTFRIAGGGALAWTLRDWLDDFCCVATNSGEKLVFPQQPPGYYWVKNEKKTFSFCVVGTNSCRNSTFAVDSALSECSRRGQYVCPWFDGDSIRVTANLMGKCGVSHTRERLYWQVMEQRRGEYDFCKPLESARKMRANGVKSLGMFGSAPAWQKADGHDLPSDLVGLYLFMSAATKAFDGYYDAWEFLNEPELGSVGDPVWEYAATLKAYALGARAGNPCVTILPGSLSYVDHDGYGQVLFDAEIAKYVQAFNLHTYAPLASYWHFHEDVRKFLKEAGVPDWQVWLTECGTELEGNAREGGVNGYGAHSREQEMIVAEFYPKSTILNRFNGVFRSWYFLFGCYNERNGGKDWGSMRRDGSVKPVHASISALSRELCGAEMLGSIRVGENVRAFLFAHGHGVQTLAFWTLSPVDRGKTCDDVLGRRDLMRRELALRVPAGDYRLVDMMGRPTRMSAADDGLIVDSTRYPQFLTGRLDLQADVCAKPVGRLEMYVPGADEDLSIVVRPRANYEDFSIASRKCSLELEKKMGRFSVEVWNFSDRAKKGAVSVSCGTIRGGTGEVVLPPWGKTDVPCAWMPPDGRATDFKLDFAGRFDGRRITRVRIPISYRWRFLQGCTSVKKPSMGRPEVWRRNDSAQRYACRFDTKENALRFDVAWTDRCGRWFYPVHDLKSQGESLDGVRYVQFEVKSVQDKVENDFQEAVLMLVYPDGHQKWIPHQVPTFNWEKRLVKLPEDAGRCTAMRIGANPRGTALTYWIRNFEFLKDKTTE